MQNTLKNINKIWKQNIANPKVGLVMYSNCNVAHPVVKHGMGSIGILIGA